jgi:TRAP transporter TAXI family solute receptor
MFLFPIPRVAKEGMPMRRATKNLTAVALILCLCLVSAALAGEVTDKKKVSLVYLGLPPGTAIYTIAIAQSQVLSRHTNLEVSVQPARGSQAMPGLLASGDAQIANVGICSIWEFTKGINVPKPYPMLRVLQGGHEVMFGFITREDSPIKSIPDLKGRKVTADFPTFRMLGALGIWALQAYGVDPAAVKILKAEDTTKACRDLAEGRTDVALSSIEGPMIKELVAKVKIRVLPFGADKMDFVSAKNPGLFLVPTQPGMTGIEAGIPVISSPSTLHTTADLPDDIAYLTVKTLLEKHEELIPASPYMKQYSPDRAVRRMPVLYHPGAVRYYKEKNLWSREMDELQTRLLQEAKKQ